MWNQLLIAINICNNLFMIAHEVRDETHNLFMIAHNIIYCTWHNMESSCDDSSRGFVIIT